MENTLGAPVKKVQLRSSHRIEDKKGNIIMGEGRREILELIEKTGSINQTAKVMKMSYRGVWGKIKATEQHLDRQIVITERRHGSRLTEYGKRLLIDYTRLKEECKMADDDIFKKIFLGKQEV